MAAPASTIRSNVPSANATSCSSWSGENANSDFFGGICFAVAISLSIKLGAITLQQKMIGERCSGFVKVRQMACVNSVVTRAFRDILKQPGLRLNKVAILIGAPDWP